MGDAHRRPRSHVRRAEARDHDASDRRHCRDRHADRPARRMEDAQQGRIEAQCRAARPAAGDGGNQARALPAGPRSHDRRGHAGRRTAQGRRRQYSPLDRLSRRQELQGLCQERPGKTPDRSALLGGVAGTGLPVAAVDPARRGAGAADGAHEELLARLAAARAPDQRLRPSAEPGSHRVLAEDARLARPRLLLPRRLQLRGQHADLQPHGGHGCVAGWRVHRLGVRDRRRPPRSRTSRPALLELRGRRHAGAARSLLPVDHAQFAEDVLRLRPDRRRPPDGAHPRRPHDGAADQRLSSAYPALHRALGPRPPVGRAGRAGRHLQRAAHRLQGRRRQLSRCARQGRGRSPGPRNAGVGIRFPAGPRGAADTRLVVGAALGGGPGRRQAGAVRAHIHRDHARQLQAAVVAAKLDRPLARTCQQRHQGRNDRRDGAMGAGAPESHEAGRSRYAHDALPRQHAGPRHHRRGRLFRGGLAAHVPEPQPRHRLRQAVQQARALPARRERRPLGPRHGRRPVELQRPARLGTVRRRREDHIIPPPHAFRPTPADPRRRDLSRPSSAARHRSRPRRGDRDRPGRWWSRRLLEGEHRASADRLDVQHEARQGNAGARTRRREAPERDLWRFRPGDG